MNKKKKVNGFLIGYLIFTAILILFWLWIIAKVKACLVTYEAAQPERLIEKVVADLQDNKLEEYFPIEVSGNRYEPADIYKKAFLEKVAGKEITYQKDSLAPLDAPSFELYADKELFGTLTLKETSKKPLMFILSVSTYEIQDSKAVFAAGNQSVTVKMPDLYRLFINDVQVGNEELTDEVEEMQQFRYAKEYVDTPKLITYQIDGLLSEPVVRVVSADGKELPLTSKQENGNLQILVDTFAEMDMDEDLRAEVLDNAKRYSNFFSKDLEGCRNSVAPIADMFPKNSYYLELADNYRNNDMWMYSRHDTPIFSDEQVTNYVLYSDVLFSCDVFFNKKMYLPSKNLNRVDTTYTRFYYGLIDGRWKIVDMVALTQESAQE